jgi:hypothetical protein
VTSSLVERLLEWLVRLELHWEEFFLPLVYTILRRHHLALISVLEESSSFWNTSLTLRGFFTALSSAFILNVLTNTGQNGDGNATTTFTFGLFPSFSQNNHLYGLSEVPVFIIMG